MIGQYKFFLRNNDTKTIKTIYIRETINSKWLIFSVSRLTEVQLTAVNCFKVGTNGLIFGTSEINRNRNKMGRYKSRFQFLISF